MRNQVIEYLLNLTGVGESLGEQSLVQAKYAISSEDYENIQ